MTLRHQGPPRASSGSGTSRYQPIAELGRGRLGDVVLARMRVGRDLKRLVVLRRMWPELASQPNLVAMFLRQARVAARLEHPNIPRTYEILDDRERPTVAVEYLDGQRLSSVMERFMSGTCPLPLAARLSIVLSVLEALDYAHGLTGNDGAPRPVLHRDISARNVVVTYEGRVKLVDFGLARSRFAAYDAPERAAGAIHYLSPEQARGGLLDHRTDLFVVGVLLWELSAGRRLWDGLNDDEILRHLADGLPLPPLPALPDLPAGLGAVCARALAVDPEDRFDSASELADEIEQAVWRADLSGARLLGEAVSVAFAPERAARAQLIEQGSRESQDRTQVDDHPWARASAAPPWPRRVRRPDRSQPHHSHQARQPDPEHERPLRHRAANRPPRKTPTATEIELRKTTVYVPQKASHQLRWMLVGFATAIGVVAAGMGVRALLARRGSDDKPAIVARAGAVREPSPAAPPVPGSAGVPAVLNALVAEGSPASGAPSRPARATAANARHDRGAGAASRPERVPAPARASNERPAAASADSAGGPGTSRTAATLRPLDRSDPFAP